MASDLGREGRLITRFSARRPDESCGLRACEEPTPPGSPFTGRAGRLRRRSALRGGSGSITQPPQAWSKDAPAMHAVHDQLSSAATEVVAETRSRPGTSLD